MNKVCGKCQSDKKLVPDKKRKSGYRAICVRCTREYQKLYRANNKKEIAENKKKCYFNRKSHYDANNAANRERSPKAFIINLFYQIKRHALPRVTSNAERVVHRKAIKLEVDRDYIFKLYDKQDGKCAISGLSMVHRAGELDSISIDRVDSGKGYVPDNVQLVCQFINLGKHIKSDKSAREFIKVLCDEQVQFNNRQEQKFKRSQKIWTEKTPANFMRNKFLCMKPRISDECITYQYLLDLYDTQNGKCALSGIKMTHIIGDHTSISIDRIDSKVGYLAGNVQLVCQFINLGKRSHSNSEVLEWLKTLRESNL
jgi:hypothetical protein